MKLKYPFLTAFFILYWVGCKEANFTEKLIPVKEDIAVKTFKLQQKIGEVRIKGTGILATENEARLSFKIGGVIDRIYVNEGDVFQKEQLLARLKIAEIDAGFVQAQLGLEKAERDLKRLSNLYKDSVATLEQLQDTKTAYEIAQKQLEAVSFNKDYAFIYALSDGFVTKKLANEGEIIGSGMPVLAISENSINAWVLRVGLSDKDWASVEIGNKAQISFDAFPNKVFDGYVHRKAQAAEMLSGSFQVELRVNCQSVKPAIGMFGKSIIKTNKVQEYQTIPYDAMIEADGKNAYVFVPLPNGKVKKQAIEIEGFDNFEVLVKSGLETVQEVILTNSAFLNENSTISIIQ